MTTPPTSAGAASRKRRPNVVIDARGVTSRPTGIARSTMTLLTGLAQLRPDLSLRVLSSDPTALPEAARTSDALDIIEAPGSPRPLSLDAGNCSRLVRSLAPDVVHSPETCAPVMGKLGARGVSVVHDLIPITHASELNMTAKGRHWRIWRAWVRLQVRRSARVMVPSAWTRAELVRVLGADASRIDIVPNAAAMNGVEQPESRERLAAMFRERVGVDTDTPIVLFVGRRAPYKDAALLVRACASLERARLVFVGPDDPRFQDAEREAERLGASVIFAGQVDDNMLAGAYAAAAVVACPSRAEGFGLAVLEALAHGVPIVASAIPPHLEVLGDGLGEGASHPLVRTIRVGREPGDAPDGASRWTRALEELLMAQQNDAGVNPGPDVGRAALAARAATFSPEQQATLAVESWTRAMRS